MRVRRSNGENRMCLNDRRSVAHTQIIDLLLLMTANSAIRAGPGRTVCPAGAGEGTADRLAQLGRQQRVAQVPLQTRI